MKLLPDEHPDKYLPMPKGLAGYWWETESLVCVADVHSSNPKAFIGFLNSLVAKGKVVFFPTVVNARLERLLRLRGFEDAGTPDKIFGFVGGLAIFPDLTLTKEG